MQVKITDDGAEEFQCFACDKVFINPVHSISRAYERVEFHSGRSGLPEVEIQMAEALASACSRQCADILRGTLLLEAKLNATYPGIGPIEACSRCSRPVDMTQFHLAWSYEVAIHRFTRALSIMQPMDVTSLAILCRNCAPLPDELASVGKLKSVTGERLRSVDALPQLLPHLEVGNVVARHMNPVT